MSMAREFSQSIHDHRLTRRDWLFGGAGLGGAVSPAMSQIGGEGDSSRASPVATDQWGTGEQSTNQTVTRVQQGKKRIS